MTDIVERLRAEAVNWSATCGDLFAEAADEIKRLRKSVEDWKRVYEQCDRSRDEFYDRIGSGTGPPCHPGAYWTAPISGGDGTFPGACSVCGRIYAPVTPEPHPGKTASGEK